MVLVAKK